MSESLAQRLLAGADALNAAAVADEYRDPFWSDRYGEQGRKFAVSDGMHHLGYLAEAVRAASPIVLVKYTRWLRSVLVTRGMCSEHLADGLRIRARHIAAMAWPDAAPALALLAAAVDALTYGHPPAADLVPRPDDDVLPGFTALDPAERRHDVRHLLSYLADALAFDRPALLHDHLAWRVGFERRRGRPDGLLRDLLAALAASLPGGPARALLLAAAEALP